jgi:hypothetical protein
LLDFDIAKMYACMHYMSRHIVRYVGKWVQSRYGLQEKSEEEMNDMRLPSGKVSIFEKKRNSGIWWIRWNDSNDQNHEMRVGAKARAAAIRKTVRLIEKARALPDWSWL